MRTFRTNVQRENKKDSVARTSSGQRILQGDCCIGVATLLGQSRTDVRLRGWTRYRRRIYFRSRSDQPGGSTTGIDGSGLTDLIFLAKALNDQPIRYMITKLNAIKV